MITDGYASVEATLTTAADSRASFDTMDRLRSTLHAIPGGRRQGRRWQRRQPGHPACHPPRLYLVMPLVLAVVLVVLGLVLRAIVASLPLAGTVVLSFGAALGISALVFSHVIPFAGVGPSFPRWTFVFLVALGADYNIFLMTRSTRRPSFMAPGVER